MSLEITLFLVLIFFRAIGGVFGFVLDKPLDPWPSSNMQSLSAFFFIPGFIPKFLTLYKILLAYNGRDGCGEEGGRGTGGGTGSHQRPVSLTTLLQGAVSRSSR